MRYKKQLFIGTVLALSLNLLCSGVALGESDQSTVNVDRVGSLSFFAIPSNFDFGTITTPGARTPEFSDPTVVSSNLPIGKRLTVEDTRGAGGFTVTLSANDNFLDGGTNTILISNTAPNDNLRIVTSPFLPGISGTTTNGVIYETGFSGPSTVNALVNTLTNDFSQESTFTNVSNNILDTSTPVVVLDGTLTLASGDGRVGLMTTGTSSMLYIPAFQGAGQYTTTLTWTLSDSTT